MRVLCTDSACGGLNNRWGCHSPDNKLRKLKSFMGKFTFSYTLDNFIILARLLRNHTDISLHLFIVQQLLACSQWWRKKNLRVNNNTEITESAELGGTYKDRWVQILALQRTPPRVIGKVLYFPVWNINSNPFRSQPFALNKFTGIFPMSFHILL